MRYKIILQNRRRRSSWIDIVLLIAAILFSIYSYYFPAILLVLMAGIGFLSRRDPYFVFSSEKIISVNLLTKTLSWEHVENVILKDGVLTIELSGNRMIQELVKKENARSINEQAFNTFCSANIASSIRILQE